MLKQNKTKQNKSKDTEGWGYDRYRSALVQRNVLIAFSIMSIIGIIVVSMIALNVANNKSLDPFVIEIEEKSGIVTLVDPVDIKKFSAQESVNNYFLIKYIRARELFDPYSYKHNFYTVVRLLSSGRVYDQFRYFIRASNPESPVNLYSESINATLKVRSIQYLSPDTAQIRFFTEISLPNRIIRNNKIAIISFRYVSMELNESERYFNPIGFQVISYTLNQEIVE